MSYSRPNQNQNYNPFRPDPFSSAEYRYSDFRDHINELLNAPPFSISTADSDVFEEVLINQVAGINVQLKGAYFGPANNEETRMFLDLQGLDEDDANEIFYFFKDLDDTALKEKIPATVRVDVAYRFEFDMQVIKRLFPLIDSEIHSMYALGDERIVVYQQQSAENPKVKLAFLDDLIKRINHHTVNLMMGHLDPYSKGMLHAVFDKLHAALQSYRQDYQQGVPGALKILELRRAIISFYKLYLADENIADSQEATVLKSDLEKLNEKFILSSKIVKEEITEEVTFDGLVDELNAFLNDYDMDADTCGALVEKSLVNDLIGIETELEDVSLGGFESNDKRMYLEVKGINEIDADTLFDFLNDNSNNKIELRIDDFGKDKVYCYEFDVMLLSSLKDMIKDNIKRRIEAGGEEIEEYQLQFKQAKLSQLFADIDSQIVALSTLITDRYALGQLDFVLNNIIESIQSLIAVEEFGSELLNDNNGEASKHFANLARSAKMFELHKNIKSLDNVYQAHHALHDSHAVTELKEQIHEVFSTLQSVRPFSLFKPIPVTITSHPEEYVALSSSSNSSSSTEYDSDSDIEITPLRRSFG